MDLELAGRTALITGSYRGTGAGIAEALGSEGARVIVHGFEPGQPDEVVARLQAEGIDASGLVADLFDDDGLAGLDAALSDVDVLVNNYGAPSGSTWEDMSAWADAWDRNVMVNIRVTQSALAPMRARGWGRIIFVGTVGTRRPGRRNAAYYGAKTALTSIVRSLAQELRGSGITANLVSPGMIATTEVREMLIRRAERAGVTGDWAEVEAWALANSMPNLTERLPDPIDIGRVVTFAASGPAWHINGADLAVDGGAIDA